jgi:hypothetical protein
MLSGFKYSSALAHYLRFLREVSVTPDRPPSSGLPHKPLSQFFDDPFAFIQSIWDHSTSDPRDLDDLSGMLEQLSHFLCQRGTFNGDYLLDQNVFHVAVDLIRDLPNANLPDLALQCLDGATCCQSTLYDFLMYDEICFQKLSAVIWANSKNVIAFLWVVNNVQSIYFGDLSGQISFHDYNVVDPCI